MGAVITKVTIVNNTHTDIVSTGLTNLDSNACQEEGQYITNHKTLAPRSSAEYAVAAPEDCPVYVKLTFRDGSEDIFSFRKNGRFYCCTAFNHIVKSHDISYNGSYGPAVIFNVSNTYAQQQNELAERLNQEAEALLQHGQYEEALKKLTEALQHQTESSTMSKIQNNINNASEMYGKALLNDVTKAEADDRMNTPQDIKNLLTKAKQMFEQANQQDLIKIVDLKLQIINMYEEAEALEDEAGKTYKNSKNDFTTAIDQYNKALNKYKEITKIVADGVELDSKNFSGWVNILNKDCEELTEVIRKIQLKQLVADASHVVIADKNANKHDEEQDNKIEHNIID